MFVGALNQNCATFRVFHSLDKCVFFLSQYGFVYAIGITLNYILFTKSASLSSSTELTAFPPQANTILSIFLRLALLKAMMPSFANLYRQIGSIPFSFITTKDLSLFSHTFFFKSIIFWHLSSVNLLSFFTIFSLSPAFEKKNWEFTSVFSY